MSAPTGPVGVGLIGVGVISDTYLEHLNSFPDVTVLAVGDLDLERARTQAEKYDVPTWGDAQVVLDHPEIQVVVNLTVPAVHAEISSAAIAAGKHVWTEKPLGLDRESTSALLSAADEAGLRVGCAPDTVLGPGVQTAKREIAKGTIGRPLFAQTSMQWQGPEVFHPNPGFLFAKGAGPLLDIGPYYFTTLVSLFGTVEKVAAMGLRAQTERAIQVGPKAGDTFPVEVPSTISVLTQFEGGQQGNSLVSFDSPLARQGIVEIHGTEGSLVVPDPNMFEGRIAYVKPFESFGEAPPEQEWIEVPQQGVVAGRGTGLLDMVRAIAEDRPHVASGEVGYHVLDVMLSAEESAASGEFVAVNSSVSEVPLVAEDFDPFASTL
ncbi:MULTISPECIES: Gfo/Idh/MocA family protein [Brachybacterium]|uniref:Oxidoreductase n=1 Tax=Brachybacterium alimentarium TaxID=47845 RepID=A0A2A3YG40_9MICO|nr:MULTISPECIES: Gfo/Idh/MocA family oxidoreductase [Brachybacterium]PCC31812.1 oxidoreductase [Brachybacterium alimentarium]PCC38280.1 oxidoreductase [Brachybacterium alimentarium]RCS64052.1 gfo/Idh/MocA family oxidoreductase [Brachybacterium sp. JB7]RCS71903.1 gfo/Idh/MocA family oxidoreductase [Brachybacterium alimentarium]RCS74263.1 gfo/Idh/MocA family oxidoreductase [Brachybacterium alimentarium]